VKLFDEFNSNSQTGAVDTHRYGRIFDLFRSGRRPNIVGRRPDSDGCRPDSDNRRPDSDSRRPDSDTIPSKCLSAFKKKVCFDLNLLIKHSKYCMKKVLERTNYYRKLHRVDPLTNNERIGADPSAIYAQKLSNTFTFKHNPG
jgi:hypothetical protein